MIRILKSERKPGRIQILSCFGLLIVVSLHFGRLIDLKDQLLAFQVNRDGGPVIHQQNNRQYVSMVEMLSKPSQERPFIFFHQRKTGGSGMRDIILKAVQKLKQPTMITCADTSCETYYTPQGHMKSSEIPSVYSGHFYFAAFQKTLFLNHLSPRQRGIAQEDPPTGLPKFSCLTIFREPLSRIKSCWNYRMVQEAKNVRIKTKIFSDIPTDMLQERLLSARSTYGEGCLNEPMRIFSDYGDDEELVNQLALQSAPIADFAVDQTISRVAKHCIVGILERCEDTHKAIDLYAPFLSPYFNCTRPHANKGTVKERNSKTAVDHDGDKDRKDRNAILNEVAKHEILVYEEANRLLDAQISSQDS